MVWRLYLFAVAGMIPAMMLTGVISGQLSYDPVSSVVGIIGASVALGLIALLIALPTYRKAKNNPVLFKRARSAVLWPGGILFVVILAGQLLR